VFFVATLLTTIK